MEDIPDAQSAVEYELEERYPLFLSSEDDNDDFGNAFANECMDMGNPVTSSSVVDNPVTSSSVVESQLIIRTMLTDLRRQCKAIHADCAMDERQKVQKLRELQYRLQSPKAGEAAPPVQPKKEKGYRMCDCPNSIRILQAKVEAGLSKNKGRKNKGQHPEEERTSVKARYCECFWETNDCSECKANGCGTDMCKEKDHYTPQYRKANPDFWKRVSNCPTCNPHKFCKIEDHYAVGYFDKGRGHRLKSCCKACKASSQAEGLL